MKITYFNAITFWLANYLVAESYKNHEVDLTWLNSNVNSNLIAGIGNYVQLFGEINADENKNVLGHSIYFDMFDANEHSKYFLPRIEEGNKFNFNSSVEFYENLLKDKIEGKEGAYVYGGILGDNYIGPFFPSALYYVLNKFEISQEDLLECLTPNRLIIPSSPKTGNSRTLATLAAVVLGYLERLENVKSIVISESSIGKLRWSKAVRYQMKKTEEGKFKYSYLEVGLYTMSEIDTMYHRVGKSPVSEINEFGDDYPIKIHGEPIYILLREYGLGIFEGENIKDLKLYMIGLRLVDPKELVLR